MSADDIYSLTPRDISNESDVEQKIVYPLLSNASALGIPSTFIQTKPTIKPLDIGKGRNRRLGYIPDYLVWANSLPVLVVEVKPPRIPAQTAYEEAQQYAHVLNSRHASGINPARYVIGINGTEILIGHWDAPPTLRFDLANLVQGDASADLYNFCGWRVLQDHAAAETRKLTRPHLFRAYNFAGGQTILRQTIPLNNFALDLAPILKRYFSSEAQISDGEILTKGYVSSEDTTKYDSMLETFLRDSLRERGDQWGLPLTPTNRDEENLSGSIEKFKRAAFPDGHLQLIIGSVGAGKSVFIRRYHAHLMPTAIKYRTRWAFVDFNGWPGADNGSEQWLCEKFLDSFEETNPSFQLHEYDSIEKIFAPLILKREKTAYAKIKSIAPQEYEIEKSRDIRMWMDDKSKFVENLCRYLISDSGEIVVTVFDNVDRLGRDEQIKVFSLAQWFKSLTKSFCLLQLRDETYELYKNEKPLDTYRTAVRFYIRPPRFVDVIKKRVKLAHDYIATHLPNELSYRTEDGKRIVYDRSDLAVFLTKIYQEIFHAERNSARIVESLAARDTRKSLETFTRIVTSGHLSTLSITSIAKGAGSYTFKESDLIRILMRTDYRLFSDTSGPISNIFFTDSDWARPSLLLGLEILYYLIDKRRVNGELGLQGYFTVEHLQTDMEKLGFDRTDSIRALNYLLERGLIVSDDLKSKQVDSNTCIKVHASGFTHQRVLAERIEYLYGITTVVPFRDKQRCEGAAQLIQADLSGPVPFSRKVYAAELLRAQLDDDIAYHMKTFSAFRSDLKGSIYTLERVEAAIKKAKLPKPTKGKAELL